MASYMFRVFNSEGQLVFEDANDLLDINDVIAQARLIGQYVESRRPNGMDCRGWTMNVHGPSGRLIMTLPWHFACQQADGEPDLSHWERPAMHLSRDDMKSWAGHARRPDGRLD